MPSEQRPNGEQTAYPPARKVGTTAPDIPGAKAVLPSAPPLQIHLLGECRLVYEGAVVRTVMPARLQALLAYLLVHHDTPLPRHHLAYLFWPDVPEDQARNNLRQALHQLRRVLPGADRFLSANATTLCWTLDGPSSLDIAEFERLLAEAEAAERRSDRGAQRAALVEAVELYRGDLLPSCYDDWIVPERERLRQRYVAALETLVQVLEVRRDYAAAIQYAQRWLRYDALAEDAYRVLMRLLALTDDRAGALRVYRTCATVLRRELGVDPSATTRALHERLLQTGALPPTARPPDRPAPPMPSLVGRQREWEQFQAAWQQASAGGPQFVFVTGEAGIGKSRLAEELLTWASGQGAVVARARSYATEGQLSLAPVTDWLRGAALRPHLDRLDPVWLSEVARILPEILTQHRELARPASITEYGQRQRFFEALARAMLSAPQPLLLLIDDLQWCDQETLEWLHFLLRFDARARLLVVGCARAEELPAQHPLRRFLLHCAATTTVLEIELQPLDAAETAQLAAQVLGHELGVQEALHLYRETDGIPLFVVETARAGPAPASEPGDGDSSVPATSTSEERPPLPPQVYRVIAERLAHLSPSARALVALAAAIGRPFTLDDLLAAGASDEDRVVPALDELWTKRIVREQGANRYDFSHDKLREVAYAEISAPQRHLLHRRIAQAFETAHAEELDAVSGQIASHYERAGLPAQAIPHYQRAAAVAQRVYANDDAISLLEAALGLLDRLPATMQRDRQELELLLALAPALRVAKGWTAPELERALDRAHALGDKVGDAAQRTQVLYGLQSLSVVQARLERVQTISDELGTLYRRSHGTAPPHVAGVMLTGARLHLGHLREANTQFAAIAASHDLDQLQRLEETQGVNFMVLALAWQSHALWCLGYPQSALDRCHDAVDLARNLAQPFNQALAATYLATLAQLCADEATARTRAEEAFALASEYQAPYYRTWAAILVAYALAWERPDPEAVARLRDAIAAFTSSGGRLRLPYYLALLAQVHAKGGHADDGLATIDEALTAARTSNERWWDAELHRLRGTLLRAQAAEASEAEAAVLRALEIARGQGARSFELRAATSLVRLPATPRHAAEGKRLLEEIYAWFTEGHATPDLQVASALLTRLR